MGFYRYFSTENHRSGFDGLSIEIVYQLFFWVKWIFSLKKNSKLLKTTNIQVQMILYLLDLYLDTFGTGLLRNSQCG